MKNALTLTVARLRENTKYGYQYVQRIKAVEVLEILCNAKASEVPSMWPLLSLTSPSL